jgi:hypothetical protein
MTAATSSRHFATGGLVKTARIWLRDEEAMGSNPATPTHHLRSSGALFGGLFGFPVGRNPVGTQPKVIKHVADELVPVVGTVGTGSGWWTHSRVP